MSKTIKQHELGRDCNFYNIDILAIQETKCTQFSDEKLPTKNRLILFDQKDSYHGGLGFVISEKICPFVEKWKSLSDRVAYLDVKLPARNGSFTNCRFVNVYCPHSKITSKSPHKLKQFYDQVNTATNVPARWELFILGDFNSKLGKRTYEDVDCGFGRYMGRYGNGTRNDNGESLLNFIIDNDLFATNTSFKHKSRHVTTYTGWTKDWSAGRRSAKTKPFYSQIDYILCRTRSKVMLQDARSFAGTIVDSDHKVVVTKIDLANVT